MEYIEIQGKVSTAICYAKVVEEEAIEQIRRMCDYPMTEGSKIRIMPDVHSGKGCTIGTTMTITDKAVPNVVGVDIGCGMYTVDLGKGDIDLMLLDATAHFIPSGMNVWEGRQERFDLTGLKCFRELKDTRRLERSLGTLGGGNHFIEVDVSSDGTKKLFYTMGDHQDWYDPEYNLLTMIFERSLEDVFTMHSDDYTGTLIRCTPDRSRMLVGGLVGETGMILLDGEGELVTPLKLMPGTIWEKYAVSDDGTTVACISAFGFVAGWDGKTGDVLYLYAPEVDSSYGGTYSVSTPVFSPDGKYLSYVISDTLFITDARSGAMLVKGGMASTNYTPELAYSSDGDYIFVTDQALYIVDAAGRLFRMLDTDASAPYNNVVQLGERMLITKGDGTAFVCCTPSAASIRSVGGDELPDLCEKYDPHIPPEGNVGRSACAETVVLDGRETGCPELCRRRDRDFQHRRRRPGEYHAQSAFAADQRSGHDGELPCGFRQQRTADVLRSGRGRGHQHPRQRFALHRLCFQRGSR